MVLPFGDMIKKFKDAQEQMKKVEEELAKQKIVAQAGAEMVKITADGKGQVLSIDIDPTVYEDSDKQILQGLLISAINDLQERVSQRKKDKITEYMKSMGLPADGFNWPF